MAKDPVCGMLVDEASATLKAEVRGTTYYFCSESCMREFLAPEKEFRRLKLLVCASFAPVSYTHLDVYKRQPPERRSPPRGPRQPIHDSSSVS